MRRAAMPLLAVLLAILLVPSVHQREFLLVQRDLLDFFLPMKAHWRDSMALGHVPWWDPWTHGGQPFFATLQSQVLYPPNALFLVGGSLAWCLSLFVALHLAWAGIGAWLLARELGVGRLASGFALVGVECGGFLVSLVDLLNQACAFSWMPWMALAACRHARSGSAASLAAWAASLALGFLAGEPQYAALGGIFSVAMAGAHVPSRGRAAAGLVGRAAVAAGLALLLTGVQIVPLAELALASTRASSDFHEGGRHALEPARLAALWQAPRGAFGGPAGDLVESIHVSAILVVLALLGAMRRSACSRMLLACVLVSVALALGPHLPGLGPALGEATPFLRYPVKFFCVAALGIPLLAALGAETVVRRLARDRDPAALAAPPRALDGRPATLLLGTLLLIAAADLVRAQRVLLPTLPAAPLLEPTPAIHWLAGATSPDGPRVHATPLTQERLRHRARRIAEGDLAGAMRERVDLMEGALPMMFRVSSTWGGTALPPRVQAERLDEATGPMEPGLVAELRAGWLLDVSWRQLPLPAVDVDAGNARLYELDGFVAPPARRWEGPNRVAGLPAALAPSSWPGWREGPPGTWTFRPTGLLPLGLLSAVTALALLGLALGRPRSLAKRMETSPPRI